MELRFPNFDGVNIPESYAIVVQTEIPEPKDTQKFNELDPLLINGVWVKQIIAVDISEEELGELKNARHAGNPDLSQSGSAPNVIE